MPYDNTKFIAAFNAWLKSNVTVGYGEHYVGDLLDDFESFLRKTKMLKRSPGRVAFGVQMKAHGDFESRKRLGLTYWSGLELNDPPATDALAPRRYARTVEAQNERAEKRHQLKQAADFEESPEAEEARVAAFKRELDTETPENIKKEGDV